MDTGGLSHMSYNQFPTPTSSFNPANGFSSRGKAANHKRLSVALPPRVSSTHELQSDVPTPRTTSRSHLLAGLRTAPKSATSPASAPLAQNRAQYPNQQVQWNQARGHPYTSAGTHFMPNQYSLQAAQQAYALPEQVLAPPLIHADDMDPTELEQLQLTGLYLAQRQQQLQQQLTNITAAAQQIQGLGMYQQHTSMMNLGQQAMDPVEVPGQPGLYLVQNSLTGQFQYMQAPVQQPRQMRNQSSLARSQTMQNLNTGSGAPNHGHPVFRAEISPPACNNKRDPFSGRSITPPTKSRSPASTVDRVEPLPPPSANAFRRGQKSISSLSLMPGSQVNEGPKTANAATFGSARQFIPPTPMTGTFGPGAARAGAHPVRQPRGPPSIDELKALPTAKHQGSRNFASRFLPDHPVDCGGVRRVISDPVTVNGSLLGESSTSSVASTDRSTPPGLYRRQSPIGSERGAKHGSQSSEGSLTGSTVPTPSAEDSNAFDMQNFVKQLPMHLQQQHGQERRKMMLGVLSAAEKRKSMY